MNISTIINLHKNHCITKFLFCTFSTYILLEHVFYMYNVYVYICQVNPYNTLYHIQGELGKKTNILRWHYESFKRNVILAQYMKIEEEIILI